MSAERAQELHDKVVGSLDGTGLITFGWFRTTGESPALLIGDVAGSIWPIFSASGYLSDGKLDPLNRWTEDTVSPIAAKVEARALYPFGGRVWPFQQWAQAATGMAQSPLGLLIHPEFGLWTALRAALVFDERFEIPEKKALDNPCDTCAERPCLNTCPVSAFWENRYYVESCRHHVASPEGEGCRANGCAARRACPIGAQHVYGAAQQRFHMRAFSPAKN